VVTAADVGPARYFAVVGLHPIYALGMLTAIVIVGAATLWLDPRELDSGLGMILFAQMFLASTGFLVRARQGHFDPVLTGPWSRAAVVAAHWVVSIAPGVIAWLVIVVAGAVAGSQSAISAVAGVRAGALVIVSTLSWAVGFRLPRGAAGMLWIALLMVLVTQRAELLAAPAGTGPIGTGLLHAATLLACPFLLLGTHPPLGRGAVEAALMFSLAVLFGVWRHSRALDIYLVDRS
jgi:hypothetical protein